MRELQLNANQRKALETLLAKRSAHAGHVRRARIVLLSADGVSGREIAQRVGISVRHVSRIRQRFIEGGVSGLTEQPKAGRKDHAVAPETLERIIQTALSPPPPGRNRWTTRLLARKFKLTSATVSKTSSRKRAQAATGAHVQGEPRPGFAAKVKNVVGLYLNPPENAIALSVDEKTSIQALERSQLPLPLRQGRAARDTHDYKRHGVLDLYAALNVATG